MQSLTPTNADARSYSPSLASASGSNSQPKTDRKRANRAESSQGIEAFFKSWAEQIKREQEKLRKLTELSVTIRRRFRGLTLSDMCGHYGIRIETNGRWLDYDAELDGEIHPINIVQPAIRANTNACLQSNAEINVESASASAKNKKIAERWQKVAAYLERFNWTEEDRSFLFDAAQTDGNILLEVLTVHKDGSLCHEIEENSSRIAHYACEFCGSKGEKRFEAGEYETPEKTGEFQCPDCGKQATGEIKEEKSYALREETAKEVEIAHRLVPFYNFCIDSYNAKTKGIDSAKYLEIHRLVDRAEIETKYPQFSFSSPKEWSYQLQVDYAFASGDFSQLNTSYTRQTAAYKEFDKFEECSVFLHEEAYSNYVSPEDYTFVNGFGEKTFDIKRGETFGEAQERFYGKNQHGLMFVWIDDRLRDIPHPDKEEINFRRRFSSAHWLRDSSGFYSAPNASIVNIQDDITLLNTYNHNIAARNAVIPVYYDDLVWNETDFSQEFIGTENAALLPDRNVKNSIFTLPIPTPSPFLSNQLQFLWQVKDSVTQSQPAMRGEAQRGETFGAQRQQLEQSYGLLTAGLKSFAQLKVKSTRQKFEIARNHWRLEQFQAVASMDDEVWDDEDVSEMCEVDFDVDLIIDYRQGSEMPESNLSREMKFAAGLQQVTLLLQAGAVITPDKMNKILERIDDNADFDFDLTGLEVDEGISQKRIKEIYRVCEPYGIVSLDKIELAKTEVVGVDETGAEITKMDAITEQIFNSSSIRFSKYENLEQQGRSFTEALRKEIGAENPNFLAVEMLTVVLGFLEEAIRQTKMAEQENDPQIIAARQATEQAKADAADQLARARQMDDETASRELQHKLLEKGASHDQELEKIQMQNAQKLLEAENSKEEPAKPKSKSGK